MPANSVKRPKHVRWAPSATIHVAVHSPPEPATPELTYSYGTLSPMSSTSSGMPVTPPLFTQGLPGPMPFNPPTIMQPSFYEPTYSPKSPSSFKLHPFLRKSSSPTITYDLTQPTSTLSSPHYGIPRSVLVEPATTPPTQSLVIVSPNFPWRITVSCFDKAYVTVDDVLEDLYRSLRVNVTPQEYHRLPTEGDKRSVASAYEQRYRRLTSDREYDEEKRKGLRRIDFLRGQTTFRGLKPAPEMGSNVCVLSTA